MNSLKKTEIYILLFITNAISMILELVAARILSPFYGSSNLVWTIIISIMLFANGVGNLWGGKLVDKHNLNNMKSILLFISALSTLIIAIINQYVISVSGVTLNESELSFCACVVALFLIPCTAIGMLSPVINKEVLSETSTIGKKSGIIYTVITLGGLTGTILGGLVLIPLLGCNDILYILTMLLFIYSFLYLMAEKKQYKHKIFAVTFSFVTAANFVGTCCVYAMSHGVEQNNGVTIINTGESYIRIFDTKNDKGESIKLFSVAGGFESAAFNSPEKRDELVFDYLKGYNVIYDKMTDAHDLLMLGGAGYSYPRYVISHYDDKSIDVVEIDEMVTDTAKKHFYLQDFIDEYGCDRLGLITADARIYLQQTEKTYDCILNDTFTGNVPARALATKEAALAIKSKLNEGGVYAANLIGSSDGYRSRFLRAEIKTLCSVFKYVWLQKAMQDEDEGEYGNWIVIASDTNYEYDSVALPLRADDPVFTDDYAPVEFLNS